MNKKSRIAAVLILGSFLLIGLYLYINSFATIDVNRAQVAAPVDKDNAVSTKVSGAPAIQSSVSTQSVSPQARNLSGPENYQYIDDRLEIMRERRPDVTYDPGEVAAAIARQDAWKPLPSVPADFPLSQEDLHDGREFIEFDSLKIETLVPGDTVKLTIEDTDQEYDVNIDKVENIDESRITWTGHIDGHDGQSYHVSFTKGTTLTVGGVDTPDGHYVIQAHGNKGWVASSGVLFKNHTDPIIPPEEVVPQPVDNAGEPPMVHDPH